MKSAGSECVMPERSMREPNHFDCAAVAPRTVISGPDNDFFHKVTPLGGLVMADQGLGNMPGDEEGCVVDVGTDGGGMSQNGHRTGCVP